MDGDGLSNDDETSTYNTDPLNPDSDGDGLNDGDEINANADPLHPDTDKDGIKDGSDAYPVDKFNPKPEFWNISQTGDFSDPDVEDVGRTFNVGDTLQMLAWSNVLNAQNIKFAHYTLKANGVKYKGDLTNNAEGTYSGQLSLTQEHVGAATFEIEVMEWGNGQNAPLFYSGVINLTISQ